MNINETPEGKMVSLINEAASILTAWLLEKDYFTCRCCGKRTVFRGGPQNIDFMRETLHHPYCHGLAWAQKVNKFMGKRESQP